MRNDIYIYSQSIASFYEGSNQT